MNTISKDQSIITQVAAKIAADLTPKTDDIMLNIANWAMAFDATTDALLQKHGMTTGGMTEQEVTQAVMSTFGATPLETPVQAPQASSGGFQVRVKGTQHGPIPAWLHAECAKVGVSEVWDNRDGLQANPKRPWFKAVTGDKAFWEPRAKR